MARLGQATPEELAMLRSPFTPQMRMKMNMSRDYYGLGGMFPTEPQVQPYTPGTAPQTVGGNTPATARRELINSTGTPRERMSFNMRFGKEGDAAQDFLEREILNARGQTPSSVLGQVSAPETPVSIRTRPPFPPNATPPDMSYVDDVLGRTNTQIPVSLKDAVLKAKGGTGYTPNFEIVSNPGPAGTARAASAASGAADDLVAQAARTINPQALQAGEKDAMRALFGTMAKGGSPELVAATKGVSNLPGLAGKLATAGVPEGALTALNGWKGGVAGMAGGIAAGALDSSDWLGGQDSSLNNTASNVLRYGALGAGIGSFIPGVGTVAGAGIGALGGLAVQGLNELGIIGRDKAPEPGDQAKSILAQAMTAGARVGIPQRDLDQIKRQYEDYKEFLPAKDDPNYDTAVTELATAAMGQVKQRFQALTTPGDGTSPEEVSATNLALQAAIGDTIRPYADAYLAEGDKLAKMYEQAAVGTPYAAQARQLAAAERQAAASQAFSLMAQTQNAPMYEALARQKAIMEQANQMAVGNALSAAMQPRSQDQGLSSLLEQLQG